MFEQKKIYIATFYLGLKKYFPVLTNKSFGILLTFVIFYLYNIGSPAVAVLKTNYRSRLVIENELKVVIS